MNSEGAQSARASDEGIQGIMAERRNTHHLSGWQRFCLQPCVFILRLWSRTLQLRGTARLRELLYGESSPKIFCFWHNRLFPLARLHGAYRGTRAIYGLVSPSKDGAWLSGVYKGLGISSVRGSSQRGGQLALRNCVGILRSGASVAITPDGPRGPRYVAKEGALWLAQETRLPLVVVGVHFQRAWRLRSWDGFYLPVPFSGISLDIRVLEADKLFTAPQMPSAQDIWQRELFALNRPQHFQSLECHGQLQAL
ncbi:MAG: lysophospholipid acyltransferase family protein [Puniceicoccales bacterium]|nr:lysophospholipid acyltransferase family protein [Puniceicoccales bacterium]